MAGTWFCYGCDENIGDNEYCPFCGMHRSGEIPISEQESGGPFKRKIRKTAEPPFTFNEAVIIARSTENESYKEFMKRNIFTGYYKEED